MRAPRGGPAPQREIRLRREALQWREVDGEMVAIDLVREAYVGANKTGALLWSAIAEGATRRRLVDLLMREYGIDSDRAGADVDDFLEALADRGLLEDAESP